MKRLPIYIILAAAALFGGCKDKNVGEEPQVVVPEIILPETLPATVFSDEGGTAEIPFKATADWTAASNREWLTVSPKSGEAGETGVTVIASANDTYDERTATVYLNCGSDRKTVSVTQKQKGALILVGSVQTVAAEGGTLTITCKANSNVTAEIESGAKAWITDVTTKGLSNYVFEFEIKANDSEDARTGNIVFTNESGTETVTVSQEGKTVVPPDDPPVDPDDPPVDPDDPPVPANPDGEFTCTNPPTVGDVPVDQAYGYGAVATGGAGGTVYHFNNGPALQYWLTKVRCKQSTQNPVTIWLSGTFTKNDGRASSSPWFDVKEVENITFIGTDDFVMDQIGFFIVRAKNIIIRNVNFRQPKADNGADAVSMQTSEKIWIDHCTFTSLNQTKDYEDGSTDITHATKEVTVSWCRYIKTQKSCLVGHSNSASADAAITASFHHNWFDQSSSRHPRVRFGTAHVYNNLFDGCSTYGVGSAYGAKVLVEYNYFDGVRLPTDICTYPAKDGNVSNLQCSVAGYLYPTENVYVNRPSSPANKNMPDNPYPLYNVQYTSYGGSPGTALTYADFKPSYNYIVTAAEDVPSVVKQYAGHGHLGYTEAPVPVDNAGISGGGSDPGGDDPDTPGGDDPDDPIIIDGSAHVYTTYMAGEKSPVATVDGVQGGSYFTTSSSSSNFSSDYNSSSVTIGGLTLKYGFKMDSKGVVSFKTSAQYNSTLQFYFVRRKSGDTAAQLQLVPTGGEAQVFDVPWDSVGDSGLITLQKDTEYSIKQKAKETSVVYVIVTETE